jgi:LysM repeat protein
MRATFLLLSAAFCLCGTASFAQTSYNVVTEPVGQAYSTIINAPIEYDENGVVKAQHFNADHLTDKEYQAILDEADRVRAYRNANGFNFESDYISVDTPTYVAPTTVTTTTASAAPSYQIELFAPESPSYATTSSAKMHVIAKGDTLYSLSKRYGTTVSALQAENAISGTGLSIGQHIRIPGTFVDSVNTAAAQPFYASSTSNRGYISQYVVEPEPVMSTRSIETSISSEKTYAVLPKDTLYKISRFTCVDVKDIIARNGISNPDSLSPGDKITLPAGHCLSR